jgi:hypothetical protein
MPAPVAGAVVCSAFFVYWFAFVVANFLQIRAQRTMKKQASKYYLSRMSAVLAVGMFMDNLATFLALAGGRVLSSHDGVSNSDEDHDDADGAGDAVHRLLPVVGKVLYPWRYALRVGEPGFNMWREVVFRVSQTGPISYPRVCRRTT